jgi:DNA-binding transcriptional ArsR family regulator
MANDAFSALARDFPVSKPTISRHLRMLEDAGVVSRAIDGRNHRIGLRPEALAETSDWIETQRERWELLLAAVDEYLEERKKR